MLPADEDFLHSVNPALSTSSDYIAGEKCVIAAFRTDSYRQYKSGN